MIGNAPSTSTAAPSGGPVDTGSAVSARGDLLRAILAPLLAIFTALVFCALLLLATGHNPLYVYGALWSGAVAGLSFSDTLVATTPYILLGLAVAVGFKGGLFNIGAEGQFIVGALGATWAGHLFEGAPAILLVILALVAGVLAGAAYAAIAGVLKVVSGAHEVITTIMLNYVATYLVQWLVDTGGVMHGATQNQQSYNINPGAQLPIIWPNTSLSIGILIALAGALLVYVLVWRTTWGFALRAVGLNPLAARSAGISVRAVTIWTMAVSGGLSGLAGAIQITGLQYALPDTIGSGFGFDAIAVAIIGLGNPIGIVLAALLLGALRNGATNMEQVAGISAPFASVIEAAILFFVAAPVIIRWIYFRWNRGRSAVSTRGTEA
ncbi:MAG: ABC transporter permease [Chloroflexota bacterium]|nr:ABC transporter permease [Chloroflexota bacterium]